MPGIEPIVDAATARAYRDAGWWSDDTLGDAVEQHATTHPEGVAYWDGTGRSVTWGELERASRRLAISLMHRGVDAGDRVAVWMDDSPDVHIAFLAIERSGATIVGIGARAGRREVVHLLERTRARFVVGDAAHFGELTGGVLDELEARGLEVLALEVPVRTDDALEDRLVRRAGPDSLYLINSTSGTTGLPKCVRHTQNRWRYFHTKAVEHGALSARDVFLSVVPAPFGFGLWTSHVTPLLLGASTVVLQRFDPEAALAAIERHRVTVLCCVSTQFIMMLAADSLDQYDLSSLRVTFTGGEAVPFERARHFERVTDSAMLQFYGSNETGLLSGTTLDDDFDRRLRTAGRVVPEMQVRLFENGVDVSSSGRGQPGCKGPATSAGYLDDEAANAQLYTADGWMLMGDICEIDDEGYLTVVGRTSDFIIRGGKNVSAPQVEADVATHPAVAHVAVVGMPDPVFGERICAYVELVDGSSLDLAMLVEHLAAQGVSKELYPERLVVLDELPRSSGAKIAKGELRADIARRTAAEQT